MPYRGRFAPSPTGPLHAGSLVAAVASWLDARAYGGLWLVRIEDVDVPRCVPGAAQIILDQLAACGLVPDEPAVYQSQRSALYQRALAQLVRQGLAYPCGCTRHDIEQALAASGQPRKRQGERVYPGTCRHGLNGHAARTWRFSTTSDEQTFPVFQAIRSPEAIESTADINGMAMASDSEQVVWHDRLLGVQTQNVSREVGDFVLKRAGSFWAYQLAVVVDDNAQGITDIVRGQDLADNTARQILLQRALGLPTPRYLHTPLVRGMNGEKLSKQNGAQALDARQPLTRLQEAGQSLGLGQVSAGTPGEWLQRAVPLWASRHTKITA
ncbi:MAG: tRNA glutamyl-Q(34) synthetase GluQRS [Polaromonas sp.]|uniref:tRNA glutamyl-Q(34) synthetase GluQRS n=1 Tax=Polaromonas sp. TaxID=1869339 RepID=UPI00180A7A18|nr:tRNA glutamyl-Q(34) synthetase GluQRS [Polaromonas sp.]NMM09216.1 tRNA glutamyl-Q(34) synthetase GluQRS [Polaromonas sp.]